MKNNTDQPLRVEVKNGVLSISIGVNVLAFALEHGDYPFNKEEGGPRFKISNYGGFAVDVKHELEREEEDGTTPVHTMLDKVLLEAMEQGSAYVEEIPL